MKQLVKLTLTLEWNDVYKLDDEEKKWTEENILSAKDLELLTYTSLDPVADIIEVSDFKWITKED